MVHIGELLLYLYIIPIYGTFNLPSGFYTIVVKFNETDTLTTSWHIQDKVFNLLVGLGVPKPLVVLVTQDDIAW